MRDESFKDIFVSNFHNPITAPESLGIRMELCLSQFDSNSPDFVPSIFREFENG